MEQDNKDRLTGEKRAAGYKRCLHPKQPRAREVYLPGGAVKSFTTDNSVT